MHRRRMPGRRLARSRYIRRCRRPPKPTPFPYTTLFRSNVGSRASSGRSRLITTVLTKPPGRTSRPKRSEEHTSELQSQSNLVCRLLLEKQKADGVKKNRTDDAANQ